VNYKKVLVGLAVSATVVSVVVLTGCCGGRTSAGGIAVGDAPVGDVLVDDVSTETPATEVSYSDESEYTGDYETPLLTPGSQFNPSINYGTFTDVRDGKTYRYVTIGTQTWMAENLNYSGSDGNVGACYGNDEDDCAIYGRLYDWATLMGFESNCNEEECAYQIQSPHQGICPAGWRVSSDDDWTTLINFVGGESTAGAKLKSTSGWNSDYGRVPGTDDLGFSALPGGGWLGSSFGNVGYNGYWWSATEVYADSALNWGMSCLFSEVDRSSGVKAYSFSLRCIRN
jgi:uncharacterized protein (TIGR02145 family)